MLKFIIESTLFQTPVSVSEVHITNKGMLDFSFEYLDKSGNPKNEDTTDLQDDLIADLIRVKLIEHLNKYRMPKDDKCGTGFQIDRIDYSKIIF